MSKQRISYFAPGPAKLPEPVLLQAQRELLCHPLSNVSVTEMSHRSPEYAEINNGVQRKLRNLLNIPSNYKVMFMHGGGTGQFAAVPLNLLNTSSSGVADYFVTGTWSSKAQKEAAMYGKTNLVLPKTTSYTSIPDQSSWNLTPNASYAYYCDNETVHGVEFDSVPNVKTTLVADMSSNFLSRQFDVSKFGVAYAGAQKNVGCAGVTIVIARDDLIGKHVRTTPSVLNYENYANDNSLYNTPPAFCVYVLGLVCDWIEQNGGVGGMEERSARSRMNVPFRLRDPKTNQFSEDLEKKFLVGSEQSNLFSLKGHRSVGGMRASIYNAVTVEDAQALVQFMNEFREKHQQ